MKNKKMKDYKFSMEQNKVNNLRAFGFILYPYHNYIGIQIHFLNRYFRIQYDREV